jgi:hypothetical protein
MSERLPSNNNYVNGVTGREEAEEDNNEKDAKPDVRLVFFFDTSPLPPH